VRMGRERKKDDSEGDRGWGVIKKRTGGNRKKEER